MKDIDIRRRVEDLDRDHGRQLLGYLARRTTADLMADVFEVVWRRRKHLPAFGEEKLWTFGVARNVLLNHRRGQRRRLHHETQQLADSLREPTQTPTQAEQDLRAALELLDPLDQETITLSNWEGFNFAEVAALLHQPAPTIRTRYRRAACTCVSPSSSANPSRRPPSYENGPWLGRSRLVASGHRNCRSPRRRLR